MASVLLNCFYHRYYATITIVIISSLYYNDYILAAVVKKKYQGLRTTYVKEKQKKAGRSGDGATNTKEWVWYKHLRFLDDTLDGVQTVSTLDQACEEMVCTSYNH